MPKNLVLVIEANQGYIRNIDDKCDFSEQNDILFTALTNTYIPLLNMLARLSSEGLNFKISLVMSAPLCSLLCDPIIQKQYVDYLDKLIDLGEKEVKRTANTEFENLSKKYLNSIIQTKIDFTETYNCDLVKSFRHFAKTGVLELIPTAATYAYLPFYSYLPEALNAQVETGLYSQRYYFGDAGEGFMLPYKGYAKPLDRILRSYGINYTILDARSLIFCDKCPETGIFAPVRCSNSLVLFGADPETYNELEGDEGFSKNSVYRSQQRDIGFDLDLGELEDFFGDEKKRIQTGFKYYSQEDDEENPQEIYNFENAKIQCKKDAETFYESKLERLSKAEEMLNGKNACLVCTISAELLGQSWFEGLLWLEDLIRLSCEKQELNLECCANLISEQFTLPKVDPYPCSSNGLGYGEDLLDKTNSWMFRYIQKATNRIINLAERFPNESSLKARLLNIGAKEVLLAQSGEWPMMIHDAKIPDYVEEKFKNEILNFSKVFDALASNTVSTEWLTHLEKNEAIFPWMNYRIFSPKK